MSGRKLCFRSFFAPRADGDEEGGGVGGDGDGAEEADAADEGADDLGGDHVEVEDVAEREIGLRGDEEDERECAANVGEDEGVCHGAHDVAADTHARGDENVEFRLGGELFHLVLGGGDGDGNVHDGTERTEDDARKEQLAEVHRLQVECLEHARLFLGDACEVGAVDGDDGEDARDEDAADGADDGTRRLDVLPADDELGGEGDDAADEERPEDDVRGCIEDEGDEPLRDEKDGEEENEECLRACHTAEADEEDGKESEEKEHGGEPVIVDDGIALTCRPDEDVFLLLRVDVKGRIIEGVMEDGLLRPRRRA